MNDTLGFNMNADTLNAIAYNGVDAVFYNEIQEIDNQYKDFRFVTEKYDGWEGPRPREVSFVSASWNFVILFVVMIMVVLNKFFAPNRFASIIAMPFQSGGEKIARDGVSFRSLISLSIVISFMLIISMFVQKIFVIYSSSQVVHDNISLFKDIVTIVAAVFVFNYLLTSFYSWLFKTYALLTVHVNLHVSTMAIASVIFIPIMMVMFFYPYRFLCVIILIILILLYIIRFIKLLIEVRMLSKLNFVNIFLYLCTVEILPVLVMVKIVVNVV
ncbi:MAG: DUF4271 domain-containing protein [Bacteroidales bacterium]|nr:DUF4271 domain-containing protein [Bacteroidales bacterium]